MAYTGVNLPLTGAGDATAAPAVDLVGGLAYQGVKIFDGTEGSTLPVVAKGTTPGSTDAGLVVRPIGSTAFPQAVIPSSQQTVTVGNPTTAVTISGAVAAVVAGAVGLTSGSSAVELTSAGSTRLAGRFTVDNPTTAVTVGGAVGLTSGSSAVELTSAGSTRSVGTVNQGSPGGSSADAWWVRTVTTGSAGGTTTVDANATLTSAGSTRLVGQVTVANPTTAVSLSSNPGLTSGSSEVALTSVGSTRLVGQVTVANPTTAVTVTSGVILGAGSSDNELGGVNLTSGSTGFIAGAVVLGGGSSAFTIGAVAQGPGSSGSSWVVDGLSFSTAQMSRATANTTVDAAVVAANANRKAMIIQNLTTVDLAIGLSTAALSTALANISYILGPRGLITFGGQVGNVPNYTGPVRGLIIGSSVITGGVAVTQFLNT